MWHWVYSSCCIQNVKFPAPYIAGKFSCTHYCVVTARARHRRNVQYENLKHCALLMSSASFTGCNPGMCLNRTVLQMPVHLYLKLQQGTTCWKQPLVVYTKRTHRRTCPVLGRCFTAGTCISV